MAARSREVELPRITRVYTRKGDDGTTSLGGGQRVPKDSLRIETYGTVDELNSQIGLALALGLGAPIASEARRIQNELFHLGADLCVLEEDKQRLAGPRIGQRHVDRLEELMDRLTAELGPLEEFILPGGGCGAAALHAARTVCRRAERLAAALARAEPVGPFVVKYLNRLSDALFVLARMENRLRGVEEPLWDKQA